MIVVLHIAMISFALFWGVKAIIWPNAIFNRIFGSILLIWTWFLTVTLLIQYDWLNVSVLAQLFLVNRPFYIAIPMLVYHFVAGYLGKSEPWNKKKLLHLVPSILVFINYLPFYLLDASQKRQIVEGFMLNRHNLIREHCGIVSMVWLAWFATLLGFWYLRKTTLILNDYYVHQHKSIDYVFKWISFFSIMFLLLFFIQGFIITFSLQLLNKLNAKQFYVEMSTMHSLMILWCPIYWLYGKWRSSDAITIHNKDEPEIPDIPELVDIPIVVSSPLPYPKSYKRDSISFDIIQTYFLEHKPYLQKKFTLNELAFSLGTQPYEVSQIIQSETKMNFNDFVNSYRIEEVKRKLLSPEFKNLTIEGIASDCGFNSRSTFFYVFKKHTGLTPSSFIEELKNKGDSK